MAYQYQLISVMDYVRHGEIQSRDMFFLTASALYFTMSDIIHDYN